jgi:hypothetical protein
MLHRHWRESSISMQYMRTHFCDGLGLFSRVPCPTAVLLTLDTHCHLLHVGGYFLKPRFLTRTPPPKGINPSIGYASLLSIPRRQYLTEHLHIYINFEI